MRRGALAAFVLVGAMFLGGCGGPIQPDELARSIQTLESTAAEGALLADHVARDRTKATFARVHARELGETADHEAEADVAPTKVRAIELADRISAALGRIQIAPDSETEGRTAQETLSRLSERAGQLA